MKPARSLGDDGKAVLSTFKKFSPKKAPGIEQESSLRFDAFDGTEWKYVGAGQLHPFIAPYTQPNAYHLLKIKT